MHDPTDLITQRDTYRAICGACNGTGWVSRICEEAARCGRAFCRRVAAHRHEYVVPCGACVRGKARQLRDARRRMRRGVPVDVEGAISADQCDSAAGVQIETGAWR